MARRRRGYTLMEMVLVMAILVILAAVGYPTVDSMYDGIRLQAGADSVRAAWADAQSRAVDEGRPYRFAVLPGKGNYRVAPHGAENWGGAVGLSDSGEGQGPALVLEEALPKGVVFTNAQGEGLGGGQTVVAAESIDPSQWQTVAVFLPDGTAEDDAEIVLHMPGTRPIVVQLRALTGVVTVFRGG
jgi:prepilin-type N-terminal cleavage/methylation domain-containing protein